MGISISIKDTLDACLSFMSNLRSNWYDAPTESRIRVATTNAM